MSIDLEPIKRRLAKATPGPWTIEYLCAADTEDGNAETAITCLADDDGKNGALLASVNRWTYGDDPPRPESDANAKFIANAPADIATLIAEVERLKIESQRTHWKSISQGNIMAGVWIYLLKSLGLSWRDEVAALCNHANSDFKQRWEAAGRKAIAAMSELLKDRDRLDALSENSGDMRAAADAIIEAKEALQEN